MTIENETPLEPHRPIVDPHHHFWDIPPMPPHMPEGHRFLLPEMLETIATCGHNITQTVFVECGAMYRADGPVEFRPVGEVEFVNGLAAMSASGRYGTSRLAAAIVGSADLKLGDRVKAVLEALIAAGNGRLRGIRSWLAHADGAPLFGQAPNAAMKGLMADSTVRKAIGTLAPLGLGLDVWCLHPQIGELSDLAAAFPNTAFILNHIGTPVDIGIYAGREREVFAAWKAAIDDLARRPNVTIKIGGLGMSLSVPLPAPARQSSATLVPKWRPWVEACIAAFGPDRCMFESNFPPDAASCSYGILWNTFKSIAAAYSESEKTALFSDTARRVYKLP